ncbi:PIN domain-containing protein, partial [Candidatus Microgenomates bacterium]|nr:PIN domain-containing protein [Candidatus Microgenomates bacterium]
SPDIKKVSVNIIDEQNAWELFQKLSGKGISFVDCLSFALMQRLKIKTAFTFDADFTRAGFDSLPK